MSDFKEIHIVKTESMGLIVHVDDRYADQLTPDEVLGVVASALYGPRPVYVRNEAEDKAWRDSLGLGPDPVADPSREGREL